MKRFWNSAQDETYGQFYAQSRYPQESGTQNN